VQATSLEGEVIVIMAAAFLGGFLGAVHFWDGGIAMALAGYAVCGSLAGFAASLLLGALEDWRRRG
jgi:hypothetical protein